MRLIGSNGHPLGEAPRVLQPGQEPVNFQVVLTPSGPAIIITIGQRTTPVPLPDGGAAALGAGLIKVQGQWEMIQAQQQQANETAGG